MNQEDPPEEIWERLINENRFRVLHIANYVIKYFDLPEEHVDDLVAAGYLGLVEAAHRYNPELNTQFHTFAYMRVKGAMIDSLRNANESSLMSYRLTKAQEQANRRKVQQSDKIKPSNVAGLSGQVEMLHELIAKKPLLLKEKPQAYGSKTTSPVVMSLSEAEKHSPTTQYGATNPESDLLKRQEIKILKEQLINLPRLERQILEEHYLQERTFSEISEDNQNMSKSWLSKLHSRALGMLKRRYLDKTVP